MTAANHAVSPALEQEWRRLGLWHDLSLADAMAAAACDHPQALLHIRGPDAAYEATLADIHARGVRLAGALARLGLRPGDALAMQLPNRLENAVIFQAAAVLGCVLVPIVHIYGPAELTHILRDSRAKALILPDRWRSIDYLDRLARLPALPDLRHRIVIGETIPPDCLDWARLPDGDLGVAAVDPGAPVLLLYTSGTTAAPKGVLHSSRGLLAELVAQKAGRQGDGGWFAPWPSGHIAGTLGVLGHALLGRDMVMLESWDAAIAAELIERFAVAQTSGTPFHLGGLLEAAARNGRDLSSLKQFVIGATSVPPAMVAASEAAGIRCTRCYGSTELPTLTQCFPEDVLEKRLTTDGRLNPGCEVRFVDDEGNDVATGQEGELAVRGPERFLGYTDEALNAASFLAGGWFLTGDIGRIDADGFVAITDRKKDVIIRGGENISSREVEDLLASIPGVIEAAVVGWPDPQLGERICAVLRVEGNPPTVATLGVAFATLGVARQKTPERIEIVADFPRTPSGKVQKAELRRQLFGSDRAT